MLDRVGVPRRVGIDSSAAEVQLPQTNTADPSRLPEKTQQDMNQQALSSLIWSVADLLRGDFRQSEYGRVILPFTVLRRLDCVLQKTKAAVLTEYASKQAAGVTYEPFIKRLTGLDFYNVSSLDMGTLMGDQDHLRANLEQRQS